MIKEDPMIPKKTVTLYLNDVAFDSWSISELSHKMKQPEPNNVSQVISMIRALSEEALNMWFATQKTPKPIQEQGIWAVKPVKKEDVISFTGNYDPMTDSYAVYISVPETNVSMKN